MQIKDKVVLVYGGTSGIGKELVCKLLKLGAYVVFTGRNQKNGDDLKEELIKEISSKDEESDDSRVLYHKCDITDWPSHILIYSEVKEKLGKSIDIVIVVAGMMDSSSIIDDSEQDGIYRTIEVNLTGAAKANRVAIQHFLKEKKAGCVINTSSIFGLCAAPLGPLYAASKHGIIGLTKSYGNLFRSTDIRVNCVAPHFVETPMLAYGSKTVVDKFGTITMDNCIDAYLRLIEDDTLNGDILTISTEKSYVEKRYGDEIQERLDRVCKKRREGELDKIRDKFGYPN
ncbi:hypothetical protein J3Q64DRAFT_1754930 [Phycomyces blakesleeanus]|uniref:Uncharacterized protein n=2 Tax=Phycomyces blakesleeanus TaxID=4837 RepID=A0A162T855_PHYB8|nr:hypothetical protein PHYBLDRAFT_152108 [Phycomyces blakesleeanus NRRL 1555(-)]OAD66842.1 hypothetical protein PHYBLDRAFT_152108 [Phycomyces blakesleeanus NRRL 1555(-)]|eukprot:XP_018284882.1 hypothetical protein PHYBLDRAFT_152108 [Phycomyces blakesleeanus NRRL 1555(-)]